MFLGLRHSEPTGNELDKASFHLASESTEIIRLRTPKHVRRATMVASTSAGRPELAHPAVEVSHAKFVSFLAFKTGITRKQ